MRAKAKIVQINQETPTIRSFVLVPENTGLPFFPGQWIDFYVKLGGEWEVAGYSVTSSPLNPKSLEIAVKLTGENPVTQYLHLQAQKGDTVWIEGGQGDFYYEIGMGTNIVLIAGGIGVTPLMSIIRYLTEIETDVEITLIYSAKTVAEFLFKQELDTLSKTIDGFRSIYTLTGTKDPNWNGYRGRISNSIIMETLTKPNPIFYVSGPPALVTNITGLLQSNNIEQTKIKYEEWW